MIMMKMLMLVLTPTLKLVMSDDVFWNSFQRIENQVSFVRLRVKEKIARTPIESVIEIHSISSEWSI